MIDRIFIPTVHRPTTQITYSQLPADLQARVTFVVQAWERPQYHYDADYLVLPDDYHFQQPYCLPRTRHYIYTQAQTMKYCILDDDLQFFRRNAKYHGAPSNMAKSKRLATADDIHEMFAMFDRWLDEPDMAVCGVGQMSNPPGGEQYRDNRPVCGSFWLNGPTFQSLLSTLDPTAVRVNEDDYFILMLLTRGYRTRITDEFVFDNGSLRKELGSTIWNLPTEVIHAEYRIMEQLFPGIYTVVRDAAGRPESGGYRNHGKRHIAWSKAYKSLERDEPSLF